LATTAKYRSIYCNAKLTVTGENEEALLFAQFTVNRLLIWDAEISSKVSQRLIEEGHVSQSNESSSGGGGGESVIRECGESDTLPRLTPVPGVKVVGF
jgi:hypothetical protein